MDKKRFLLLVATDLMALVLSMVLTINLQYDWFPWDYRDLALFVVLAFIAVVTSLSLFGVYSLIWQYAGIKDFLKLAASITAGIVIGTAATLIFIQNFPWRVVVLNWLISIILLGGIRFTQRLLWEHLVLGRNKKNLKMLIIGAGEAGALIARTLQTTRTQVESEPIGFIDDDLSKTGMKLYGLPVLGTRKDIPVIKKRLAVDEAIIAIPSATPDQISDIADICHKAGITTRILPSVLDIIWGRNLFGQARELHMEDLLRREEVETNFDQVRAYLKNQVVLVTGAGGSIGSEICRQICAVKPQALILVGRGENSIYEINSELSHSWPEIRIVPVIADIKDEDKLMDTFTKYRPTVVFHAAAHKHVDFMELHPEESFKNNVFGTLNVARMSDLFQVQKFVLISTDKAVNPTGVMGLTKLLAEMIIRRYAETSVTKFVAVRFGNVLGSRGSVVHLFRKQIASGGPVTITHPEMHRYFMTIREAVQLVMQAGALAHGGEVFLLDMGNQIKIVDLANDMIRLCGYRPGIDIEIKFVGVRPGEKLYEELTTDWERILSTVHKKIFKVETDGIDRQLIDTIFKVRGFPLSAQLKLIMNSALLKFNLAKTQDDIHYPQPDPFKGELYI